VTLSTLLLLIAAAAAAPPPLPPPPLLQLRRMCCRAAAAAVHECRCAAALAASLINGSLPIVCVKVWTCNRVLKILVLHAAAAVAATAVAQKTR
jgi:hypothetical protein